MKIKFELLRNKREISYWHVTHGFVMNIANCPESLLEFKSHDE